MNHDINVTDKESHEIGSLGDFIKHEREAQSMTLAMLAEKTGVSASYINRMERGDRKTPSIKIIERLSRALNVPVSSFLTSAKTDIVLSENIPTLSQLLYANDFKIKEGYAELANKEKKALIELFEFISDMKWDKDKHQELAKLLERIDAFYAFKKKS